jgi:serine/threonine-protein kinase
MTEWPTRAARLDALFDAALDLDAAARATFVEKLRADDPDLADELAELLTLAERSGAWLDPAGVDRRAAWSALAAHGEHDEAGQRVGVWRLVRRIGSGGMGSVFEAARESGGFAQRAALKLIRADIATPGFLAHFERERQILASLNHPGIAHLVDGGRLDDGRPYLVMEYVDGLRIDRWCDERGLDLDARVALFVQVADALDHAHARRIVHRDLKPSNVVVTAEGVAKLLDFGIAKVLDSEASAERTQHTAARLFTPDYATPEQVRGEESDTRSDVYQLGLLLYELVSGQRAQQPADVTAGALERAICIDDPPLPSATAGTSPPQFAAKIGGLAPAALARRLRGDLDVIVMKALRKEPARRYASVRDLVDDLRRWQHHLPVRARPETLAYRTARFVRRHAWPVAGAGLVFALTVAYALAATLQAREIARQRDLAQTEARKASEVKSLVLRLFEGADPERGAGKELSARELLDFGWQAVDAELDAQPEVQVELLTTVGETYRQLGSYDQANPLFARARDLALAHAQVPASARAAALRGLGRTAITLGRFDESDALLREAETLYRAAAPAFDGDVAATLNDRGMLAHMRANYADAAPLFSAALAERRRLFGEKHRDVAESLGWLGNSLRARGDYRAAEPLLRQSLALNRELLPAGHSLIANGMSNLAAVQRSLGRYTEAEALYREALADMIKARGEDHIYVATMMNNLARVLRNLERYDEAESLLLRALDTRRRQLGEKHPAVAMNLSDLGWVTEGAGRIDVAERYYRQALALYPPDHTWRSSAVLNLGNVLEKRGDLAGAERQYREALAAQRAQYGAEHEFVGIDLRQLGIVLTRQGRHAEAQTALREAVRIFEARFDADDPRIAEALVALGDALREDPQALPLLRRAHAIRVRAYGADDARTQALAARLPPAQ